MTVPLCYNNIRNLRNKVDQRERIDLHTHYVTIIGERRLVALLTVEGVVKFDRPGLNKMFRPSTPQSYGAEKFRKDHSFSELRHVLQPIRPRALITC